MTFSAAIRACSVWIIGLASSLGGFIGAHAADVRFTVTDAEQRPTSAVFLWVAAPKDAGEPLDPEVRVVTLDPPSGRLPPLVLRIGQKVQFVLPPQDEPKAVVISDRLHNLASVLVFPKGQGGTATHTVMTSPFPRYRDASPSLPSSYEVIDSTVKDKTIRGDLLVVNHSYAAITDEKGTATIRKLSPGTHRLTAWHASDGYINRLRLADREIDCVRGNFDLVVADAAEQTVAIQVLKP